MVSLYDKRVSVDWCYSENDVPVFLLIRTKDKVFPVFLDVLKREDWLVTRVRWKIRLHNVNISFPWSQGFPSHSSVRRSFTPHINTFTRSIMEKLMKQNRTMCLGAHPIAVREDGKGPKRDLFSPETTLGHHRLVTHHHLCVALRPTTTTLTTFNSPGYEDRNSSSLFSFCRKTGSDPFYKTCVGHHRPFS